MVAAIVAVKEAETARLLGLHKKHRGRPKRTRIFPMRKSDHPLRAIRGLVASFRAAGGEEAGGDPGELASSASLFNMKPRSGAGLTGALKWRDC